MTGGNHAILHRYIGGRGIRRRWLNITTNKHHRRTTTTTTTTTTTNPRIGESSSKPQPGPQAPPRPGPPTCSGEGPGSHLRSLRTRCASRASSRCSSEVEVKAAARERENRKENIKRNAGGGDPQQEKNTTLLQVLASPYARRSISECHSTVSLYCRFLLIDKQIAWGGWPQPLVWTKSLIPPPVDDVEKELHAAVVYRSTGERYALVRSSCRRRYGTTLRLGSSTGSKLTKRERQRVDRHVECCRHVNRGPSSGPFSYISYTTAVWVRGSVAERFRLLLIAWSSFQRALDRPLEVLTAAALGCVHVPASLGRTSSKSEMRPPKIKHELRAAHVLEKRDAAAREVTHELRDTPVATYGISWRKLRVLVLAASDEPSTNRPVVFLGFHSRLVVMAIRAQLTVTEASRHISATYLGHRRIAFLRKESSLVFFFVGGFVWRAGVVVFRQRKST